MLDSQQILISIDKRLVAARKEIASLEAALTAMRKPSQAAEAAREGTPARAARTNGAAAASVTTKAARSATPKAARSATPKAAPSATATATASANGTASAGARSRRTRRAPARRRAQVVPAGKLVTLLGSNEGMTTSDLADQTGGDRQQLLTLLRELEAAGQVRRSGERRNTRWHVITDEDRIAARVAELERQSSRGRQKV
jgi:hypothetical protein